MSKNNSNEPIKFKLKDGTYRVFSLADHGEDYAEIAKEFSATNGLSPVVEEAPVEVNEVPEVTEEAPVEEAPVEVEAKPKTRKGKVDLAKTENPEFVQPERE